MSLLESDQELQNVGLKGVVIDPEHGELDNTSSQVGAGEVDPESYANLLSQLMGPSEKSSKATQPQILTIGSAAQNCDCEKHLLKDHIYHLYHSDKCKARPSTDQWTDSIFKDLFNEKSLSLAREQSTGADNDTRVASFKIVSVAEIKSRLDQQTQVLPLQNGESDLVKPGM